MPATETATETVTLTLTRAQLAAVRGALHSRIEACVDDANRCVTQAAIFAVADDPRESDERASADRWARMASDAASALAVVEPIAERVFAETHAA